MWAALFPGQGSQAPGMGKYLYDQFKLAKDIFEEGSDALHQDLKTLCFEGSEADLALTENTQPVLVLVSTATFRVLQNEIGFAPQIASGHSVGEYSAVVAAGGMDLASALKAVRVRGQAMQSAVPVGQGGMTAVMGLDANQINQLCAWAEKESKDGPIQAANINAPGQIVISGKKSVLDFAAAHFKPEAIGLNGVRVKFIPLKVSAPFHSSMMKPAEEKMAKVLGDIQFKKTRFPVVQNVTAETTEAPETLRANLITQISAPVRWIECVEKVVAQGAKSALEVGSGKVISGLVKKITPDLPCLSINSIEDLKAAEVALKGGSHA